MNTIPPPADIAQPCPKITHLSGDTGVDILPYILQLHTQYKDCASWHKASANACSNCRKVV
ncbi:hypothetical protein BWD08_11220 [Neisseria animaloris]|nr:hypothetical protein BWD08_11220 [Neisseria animaloris]